MKCDPYLEFLKRKIPRAEVSGFEPPSACHPSLKPHQRDAAEWLLRGGRRAGFLNFGLGKTRIQLQVARWITEQTGGRYLIVAPLGVRQEFTLSDGPAMGMQIDYVRTDAEVRASRAPIVITNYERVRDGGIDVGQFAGAGLDEASVLRSYGSETYQRFGPIFRAVPYRFVFTATPAPNRYKELIHYAGFLGIMDTGEALTRFFQRDSEEANNLTLYPHMEKQFWHWLGSWGLFVQRPSDLGYSDEGYDLPEMRVHWHRIEDDHREAWSQVDSWGQHQLFKDQSQGLSESAKSKRASVQRRVERAIKIMAATTEDTAAHGLKTFPTGDNGGFNSNKTVESGGNGALSFEGSVGNLPMPGGRHWIIWHDLERERAEIERRIPEAKTVYGSQELEEREELIMGFTHGAFPILATKPIIAGSGCNFQRHCADAIFLGVGYKFNDFIQAIHRLYRFQQTRVVNIHILFLESEASIMEALKAKWTRHTELMARMAGLLQQYKLTNATTMELIKSLGCERKQVNGSLFSAIQNDCVAEARTLATNSVDLIVTSIPFGNQYEYTPSVNDFGHNTGDKGFFEQMDFLIPELLRALKPGRVACIHVKDRVRFGNATGKGMPTVGRFSDKTADAFERHGFEFMARITIDTDVVRENNQTYRLGWSENAKDSSKMGAGMPEYVLVLRKLPSDLSTAYADQPVVKSKEEYTRADWQIDAAGFWRSSGNRLPDPAVMQHMSLTDLKKLWIQYSQGGGYNHAEHVELAKSLEAIGKLPSSFMLFPPVSRHKDVWTDISRMKTLNTQQAIKGEEKHVCPLQLDLIQRCITRYSNAGETVLDPFGGIGSVPYQAMKMGRRGVGIELNEEYWRFMVGYCETAEREASVPTLFDLAGKAEVAA